MSFITKLMALVFSLLAFLTPAKNSNKWLLTDFPKYDGGVLSSSLYDAGSGREVDWKDSSDANNNYAQFVSKTGINELKAYTEKLEKNGFIKIYQNQVGYNYFYAFIKDDKQLYITFNAKLGEARIMDNSCSDRIDAFGYSFNGGQATTVYQYNFPYYDPDVCNDDTIYSRNGMCYIIRLSDGKLVVIDGGSTNQSAEENVRNLVAFMHEITGTQQGEKINVALWYGTHPHSDHILVFSKALHMFPDDFNIERFAYNYQSYSNCEYNHRADWYRQQTNEMFPEAKYLKIRTGMQWDIADAHFQVLCTHEEAVSAKTGVSEFEDANDCSSIVKITINGTSFMFTGDTDLLLQNTLLARYDSKTLHSDFMQGPHHMINTDEKLYKAVSPTYVLAPQSKLRTENYFGSYDAAKKAGVKKENFLFASEGTYGVTPLGSGKVDISLREADFVTYDGSDFEYNFNK